MSYILLTAVRAVEPPPPVEGFIYVDTNFPDFTGTNLNTGITPTSSDPTEWEVYRNGIRQNYGEAGVGSWTRSGSTIIFNDPCENDWITVRHPIIV